MKYRHITFVFLASILFLTQFGCGSDSENPVVVNNDPADRVPELNMFAVSDPTTDVVAVIESDVEEKLVLSGEKNILGIPTKITGFTFIDAADKAFSIQMNTEGLPEYIAVGGVILRLYNYTDNSVDAIVSNEDGEWVQAHDVALDPTTVEYLRNFVFSGFPLASTGDSQAYALSPEEALGLWGDVKNYAKKGAEMVKDVAEDTYDVAQDVYHDINSVTEDFVDEVSQVFSGFVNLSTRLSTWIESTVNTVGPWVVDLGNTVVGQYIIPIYNDIKDFFISSQPNTAFEMQVSLRWGTITQNLDIHLWTPMILGSSYHVSPSTCGAMGSAPFAQIDGFRSDFESLSIKEFHSGTYFVSVHHAGGLGLITTSGATIEVEHSNGTTQTFDVPTGVSNPNAWWNVLSINGNTGVVTAINTITDNPPY